jgi:hypothetical protein
VKSKERGEKKEGRRPVKCEFQQDLWKTSGGLQELSGKGWRRLGAGLAKVWNRSGKVFG